MCRLLLLDSGDLEDRQLLTVPLPLVVAGLVLELVDADLGTLGVLEHLAGHGDLLEILAAGLDDCVRRHRSSSFVSGRALPVGALAMLWCGAASGPLSSASAERQLVQG